MLPEQNVPQANCDNVIGNAKERGRLTGLILANIRKTPYECQFQLTGEDGEISVAIGIIEDILCASADEFSEGILFLREYIYVRNGKPSVHGQHFFTAIRSIGRREEKPKKE